MSDAVYPPAVKDEIMLTLGGVVRFILLHRELDQF